MPLHVDERLQMSDHPLIDRVGELLETHDCLYGMICRDATLTDIELMAQAGYHVVWLDLEHGPQSTQVAIELGRTISHLGMVPLVRIPELSRTYMQILLDGGIQIMTLPDVRSVEQTRRFVQLGKYPPMGERGVSSSTAGNVHSVMKLWLMVSEGLVPMSGGKPWNQPSPAGANLECWKIR